MPDIRHPTRRRLDEAEAQLGKLLGNPVGDEIAKGHDWQDPIVSEGVVALDIEQLHQVTAARAGMDADRDIEFFC